MTYRMFYGDASGVVGEVHMLRADSIPGGTAFVGTVTPVQAITLTFLELHWVDTNGDNDVRSNYFQPTVVAPWTTLQLTLQVLHTEGLLDLSQFNPLPTPPAFNTVAEADAWLEAHT